jgi:hypothetical protein
MTSGKEETLSLFKKDVNTEPVKWPKHDLTAGDWVKRSRYNEGRPIVSQATGEVVRVLALVGYVEDATTKHVALLSDQTWEFVWNLHKVITHQKWAEASEL